MARVAAAIGLMGFWLLSPAVVAWGPLSSGTCWAAPAGGDGGYGGPWGPDGAGGSGQAGERDGITGPKTSLSGFIEAIRSQGLKGPGKTITSRVKFRLEAALEFEGLYGLASAQAEKNWAIGSETGVDPHEVWIEHVGDGFDVRVGRQIIIWGKADGIQITDLVCPPDYTEFI
ncbi:MAG: hypothetical protein LBL95_02700, partial [Deltaproteobacteria bacterium]|nr:hypothetical protein [Deltaproteobacteria bacterium]